MTCFLSCAIAVIFNIAKFHNKPNRLFNINIVFKTKSHDDCAMQCNYPEFLMNVCCLSHCASKTNPKFCKNFQNIQMHRNAQRTCCDVFRPTRDFALFMLHRNAKLIHLINHCDENRVQLQPQQPQ